MMCLMRGLARSTMSGIVMRHVSVASLPAPPEATPKCIGLQWCSFSSLDLTDLAQWSAGSLPLVMWLSGGSTQVTDEDASICQRV